MDILMKDEREIIIEATKEKGEVRMKKICLRCGNELSDNAKYCSKCGSQYEELKAEAQGAELACQEESKFCTYCGNRISMNAKFCPICGNSLILSNNKQDQMKMQKEDVLTKVKKV